MSEEAVDTVIVEPAAAEAIRSPADVLRLVVAAAVLLVLLVVQWLFGDTLTRFAADLLSGLAAIPDWIVNVVIVGTRILVVVVIGGGFVVTLLRGRWRFLCHGRRRGRGGRGRSRGCSIASARARRRM